MGSYKLINLKTLGDERGSLIAIEPSNNFLFEIKRAYYIFDTKKGVKRGFHAHNNLKQLVISVNGSCDFIIDDGKKRKKIRLDNPNKGLFINGLIWREMENFSRDCVLLVLASECFKERDYIRNYKKFLKILKNDT